MDKISIDFSIEHMVNASIYWRNHRAGDLEVPVWTDLAPEYQDVIAAKIIAEHRSDGIHHVGMDQEMVCVEAGRFHNIDGPAYHSIKSGPSYWIDGHPYDFDEWCGILNKSDKEKALLLLKFKV